MSRGERSYVTTEAERAALRRRNILLMAKQGATIRQIAQTLGHSLKTTGSEYDAIREEVLAVCREAGIEEPLEGPPRPPSRVLAKLRFAATDDSPFDAGLR
jgi:hypothetical protein